MQKLSIVSVIYCQRKDAQNENICNHIIEGFSCSPYQERRTNQFQRCFQCRSVFNRGAECLYRHPKLHTIRGNYELWAKRFEQIERGEAKLSIRQWSGKPYHSKQEIICNLTKADGIGIQKMVVAGCATIHPKFVGECSVDCKTLAHNDGLSDVDWRNWFERYDLTEPLAVIHFTKFRYR